MDEDFEVERRVSNVVEVQFLDIAEASLFEEWVGGPGRTAFRAWLKDGAETIEGAVVEHLVSRCRSTWHGDYACQLPEGHAGLHQSPTREWR